MTHIPANMSDETIKRLATRRMLKNVARNAQAKRSVWQQVIDWING
ncbi:MAG: hypothetical protein ACKO0Z_06935 [Betaproteobacteria bacterium]